MKKGLTIAICLLMLLFTGCSNGDAKTTTVPSNAVSTATPTSSEDLTSEGNMDDGGDAADVVLTEEEKAFFGSYKDNSYTNNWLGFTMTMPNSYSFYSVPKLFELYGDTMTNMAATKVKDKKTGIALGNDKNGNCMIIDAIYIKSNATITDATSYITTIKNDLKSNSDGFTSKDGQDEKIKGTTYKTFTCEYSVDDKFYEKHYWTVKDGYVVDICFSASSTEALNQLTTAFRNSK